MSILKILSLYALSSFLTGCGMHTSSSGLHSEPQDDISLGSADDLWRLNSDMALLSDYIYQLREPRAGVIPWSPEMDKEMAKSGYELLTVDPKHGEFAIFVHLKQSRVVVVFRGTNLGKTGDVLTNVDMRLTHFDSLDQSKGKVTSGYLNRWLTHRNAVLENLQATLLAMGTRDVSVVFTGHSLGGAVATIAAMQVFHNGLNVSAYSFAVPHFADDEFVHFTKTLVNRGMLISSHEVLGDPIINTIRPARNPLADDQLLSPGERNYFIHEPLPEFRNPHSIAHIRSAIQRSPSDLKKSFFKHYKARSIQRPRLCL